MVGVATKLQPDVLSGQSLTLNLTRAHSFTGPVATFTDLNVQTASGRFVATINWGNGHRTRGTVSGFNGTFAVSGSQIYARLGAYQVQVTVTMSEPGAAEIVVNSTAQVSVPAKSPASSTPVRVFPAS